MLRLNEQLSVEIYTQASTVELQLSLQLSHSVFGMAAHSAKQIIKQWNDSHMHSQMYHMINHNIKELIDYEFKAF